MKFKSLLKKLESEAKKTSTIYKVRVDSEIFVKKTRISDFTEDHGISPLVLKKKEVHGNIENALLELNKLNPEKNLLENLFYEYSDKLEGEKFTVKKFIKYMQRKGEIFGPDIYLKKSKKFASSGERCVAITQKGTRCKKSATHGKHCHLHQ